jgi:hypothetical protein
LKKIEDSIEVDTNYEHQKAKDYLTQQHRNSKNSSITKKNCIQTFLQGLVEGDQKIKQVKNPSPPLRTSQGTWAKRNIGKTHAFAERLAKDFQLHPSENEPEEENALTQVLETLYHLEPPINCLNIAEVQEVINSLNPKKSPHFYLIAAKILK